MKKLTTNFLLLIFLFLSGYSQSYASLKGGDSYNIEKSIQNFLSDNTSLDREVSVFNPIHSYEHNKEYVFDVENEEENEEIESHEAVTQILGNLTEVFAQEPNLGFTLLISSIQKNFSYVSLKRYLLFCVIRI